MKGRLTNEFTPRVTRGIRLHRRIDAYTDRHPSVLQMKGLMSPGRRRFAGIILDIGFDHFLSCHWQQFSDQALRPFIDSIYQTLGRHESLMPPGLRNIAPRMIEDDWLGCYATLEGTGEILNRVARRFRRKNPLRGSVDEIERNYESLEAGFLRMFPEIIDYAQSEKHALGAL